jgi:hypothetical protein
VATSELRHDRDAATASRDDAAKGERAAWAERDRALADLASVRAGVATEQAALEKAQRDATTLRAEVKRLKAQVRSLEEQVQEQQPLDDSPSPFYWYCWDDGHDGPHHLGYPVSGDHLCTDSELRAAGYAS